MFTMCHYKRKQKKQKQKKKKWNESLIAVLEEFLKIQAQSLKATNEIAQFKRQVARQKL